MAKHPIRDAGLRSCCLEALADLEGEEKEGDSLVCEKCLTRMHLRRGYWTWWPAEASGVEVANIIKFGQPPSKWGKRSRGGRWTGAAPPGTER